LRGVGGFWLVDVVECRDANDVGGFAGVSGIEDAAEFVVAAKERIGFVNEKSGLSFFDDAKEGRRADVSRDDRATDEFAEDTEQSGFATAFGWRCNADVRADVAEIKGISVKGPESERFGRPLRKDDETFDELGQGIEQWRAIDGFGPQFDLGEFEEEVGWSV